jgi:hypothetical protein
MKKDSKQRLFEVMARVDKTFKSKLNESDDPCWNGYKQYGTKEKDGKEVPNCVPTNEEINQKMGENVTNKKTFTINLWGEDDEVHFEFDNYSNNDALAVELVSADGEPYATVSVNVPGSEQLPKDEFFLKDWSENEPLAKALVDMGAIIPTGKRTSSGFIVAKSYKISPEYL